MGMASGKPVSYTHLGLHGRTLETIAATMQDWLQDSFRPLPGGFVACTPNDVDELLSLIHI